PGAERIDLTRRPLLGRLLLALARRHEEARGAPLAQADLLSAGWPTEEVPRDVGQNRLRVAIATLRRLGLGNMLITRPDAYLLQPELRVSRLPAEPSGQA